MCGLRCRESRWQRGSRLELGVISSTLLLQFPPLQSDHPLPFLQIEKGQSPFSSFSPTSSPHFHIHSSQFLLLHKSKLTSLVSHTFCSQICYLVLVVLLLVFSCEGSLIILDIGILFQKWKKKKNGVCRPLLIEFPVYGQWFLLLFFEANLEVTITCLLMGAFG